MRQKFALAFVILTILFCGMMVCAGTVNFDHDVPEKSSMIVPVEECVAILNGHEISDHVGVNDLTVSRHRPDDSEHQAGLLAKRACNFGSSVAARKKTADGGRVHKKIQRRAAEETS